MSKTLMLGRKQLAGGFVACGIALLCAGTVLAGPKGAVGDLYVTNRAINTIVQIDSVTGAIVGDFVTGLSLPYEARFGPNGNLFVLNTGNKTVTEHDGNTGDLIGTFVSGLTSPGGLRFEANGNLLVIEFGINKEIKEFDTAGNLIGTLVTGVNGDAVALEIGPDGNLYSSNWWDGVVQRFAPDGTDLGIFASGGSLNGPEGLAFGPNGNLFAVAANSSTVVEFDGTTGALIGDFITTNLRTPIGITFDLDGNIWVGNIRNGDVNQFDGTTGAWMQQVTGLDDILGLTVKPRPAPCLDITVSTLTAGQKATWDITGATAGSRVAVVYGFADGETIVNDKLGFCATFGIRGVKQSRLVGMATADDSGNASVAKMIPKGAAGLTVLTQAAEQGTCPDECVSNIDDQIIG